MKIPAIKHLVETQDPETLNQASAALEAEQQPAIDVPGDSTAEQLTNVLAAIYVKNRMSEGVSLTDALREYGERVRATIS